MIITHNPITMARMNRLYGVTMAERGISQLVSVDLEDAVKLREASWSSVALMLVSHVSRAQRSTKWCAADPGPPKKLGRLERSRLSGAPLRKSFALHRSRDTTLDRQCAAASVTLARMNRNFL